MCDNSAASIAAVSEVPEVDRGQFEPARCDMHRQLELLRSDDRARSTNLTPGSGEKPEPARPRLPRARFDAACAGGAAWPVRATPAVVALDVPPGLAWRRGHFTRVERPPAQG
jgi:hypothetical protein